MGIFLKQVAPVALGAVLLAFAFPMFHWWPLAWVALVPLFVRAGAASPRGAAGWFFFAGWLFHSLLLQWLWANVMWAGGWAVLGQQGLCIALALFWAPVGWAWRRFGAGLGVEGAAVLLAVLWGGMEWLHANVLTGFGWSALGYAQGPDLVFAQVAALGGVSFLSVLLVLVNALLAGAWAGPRRGLRLGLAAGVIALAHAAGYVLLHEAAPRENSVRVGIYQSNYPIEMKYDRDYTVEMVERAAAQSAILSREYPVDLMVWPEALVMNDFMAEEVRGPMRKYCAEHAVGLFAGSIRDDDGGGFNSSVLLGKDGEIIDHYDKVHLVPFGEYVPFAWLFPFLKSVVPRDASIGGGHKVLSGPTPAFGPMICFEVLYNGIAEELYAKGASYLTVITNLAWFGMSGAAPQELEVARFRAIETRLPLVHASNTGISGVFDPYGRLEHLHGFVRRDGAYIEIPREQFPVEYSRGERLVGGFELPAAGTRPWAQGTAKFTAGYVLIALALGVWGWRRGGAGA